MGKYYTPVTGPITSQGGHINLEVVDNNSSSFTQAMDHVANELAEQNRLTRLKIRLRLIELKQSGKLSDLDDEAVKSLAQEAGEDKAI